MKTLIFLLISSIGYCQKIDSYKTDDFRNKPQTLIIFVAVGSDVEENKRVANNMKKMVPESVTVKKILPYNKAWIKDYDEMIFDESLKDGAIAVLKLIAVDAEQRQQTTLDKNLFLSYNYKATKYECTLEYTQTHVVLWKAVSNYDVVCPYLKFMRQAIKDDVL